MSTTGMHIAQISERGLRGLIEGQGMTMHRAAEVLGYTFQTVESRCKEWGIAPRTRSVIGRGAIRAAALSIDLPNRTVAAVAAAAGVRKSLAYYHLRYLPDVEVVANTKRDLLTKKQIHIADVRRLIVDDGLTVAEAARALGCAYGVVAWRCQEWGIPLPPPPTKSSDVRAAALAIPIKERTKAAIASALGVSVHVAQYHLRRLPDVEIANGRRTRREVAAIVERLREIIASGATQRSAAKELGISKTRAQELCSVHGIASQFKARADAARERAAAERLATPLIPAGTPVIVLKLVPPPPRQPVQRPREDVDVGRVAPCGDAERNRLSRLRLDDGMESAIRNSAFDPAGEVGTGFGDFLDLYATVLTVRERQRGRHLDLVGA